jgi:chaperonin GroES
MNLKPLGERVIVKPAAAEETTKSGLVIPDTAQEKPQKGTVVAAGEGKWDEDGERRIPLDVAAGDTVIYGKYGGTEIKIEGEDFLILRADDIYAIVDE